jgi:carboxylesterase
MEGAMQRHMIHNAQLEGDPFHWAGGPDGVLLIHGYTATTAEVRPLARFLCEQGYTVAGPLLPGHYTTPADANRYTWQDWTRAIETAYREIATRYQRVIVGGESTGAILSLYLASEHPEIIALLCYAPALRLTLSPAQAALLRLIAPFKSALPKGQMSNAELWQGYPVNPLKGAVQLLDLQRAVRRRLARVRQPLLLMQGRRDVTVSARAPGEIAAGVRSVIKETYWLDNSAHTLLLGIEQVRAFELTLDFIQRVLGRQEAPWRDPSVGTTSSRSISSSWV